MLPSITPRLPPNALNALADYLEEVSKHFHEESKIARQAAINAQENQSSPKHSETAKAEIIQIGDMIADYIQHGSSLETAMQLARKDTGRNRDATDLAWALHQRRQRENRTIAIKWLKSQGWTDAQISHAVGLHQKSVARIRRQS